jgi:hypothetical protein
MLARVGYCGDGRGECVIVGLHVMSDGCALGCVL